MFGLGPLALQLPFFFNDPATTEIYTSGHALSLHDALPIFLVQLGQLPREGRRPVAQHGDGILDQLGDPVRALVEHQGVRRGGIDLDRSEEHTSELQSLMRISYAVFCLKKKNKT